MENLQPIITRGQIELYIPHNGKYISFIYPAFGSGTYLNVGKEILEKGLQVPIGDKTASLLHSVYCSNLANEPEFQNIQQRMKSNWFWVYNKNLWTPQGVFVVPDYEAQGLSKRLNIKELEKEILKENGAIELPNGIRFSKNKNVRFAPKGSYVVNCYVSPEEFAKDGFIIASCDEKGAEKLGEVSSKFRGDPYISGLNIKEGNKSEQRVSAVGECGVGLGFDGLSWSDYWCHAFGVKARAT